MTSKFLKEQSKFSKERGCHEWRGVAGSSQRGPKQTRKRLRVGLAPQHAATRYVQRGRANRLEKLRGDLADFYSIRVNDQWRVIFTWRDGDAHDVSFVDYH